AGAGAPAGLTLSRGRRALFGLDCPEGLVLVGLPAQARLGHHAAGGEDEGRGASLEAGARTGTGLDGDGGGGGGRGGLGALGLAEGRFVWEDDEFVKALAADLRADAGLGQGCVSDEAPLFVDLTASVGAANDQAALASVGEDRIPVGVLDHAAQGGIAVIHP